MHYQEISYLIALCLFTGYIVVITVIFGILPSISESFYELKKMDANLSKLFTYVMSIIAVMVMVSCEYWSTLMAGTGLLFVGAAPYFKNKTNKYLHYMGALIAVIGTQIYVIHLMSIHLQRGMIAAYLIAVVISVSIIYDILKNYLTWIEILFFSSFFLAQGIHLIK